LKDSIDKQDAAFHAVEEENTQLRLDMQDIQATTEAKDHEIVRLQVEVKMKDQTINQLRAQILVGEQQGFTSQHSLEMEALQKTLASSQGENILLGGRIQALEALQAKNIQSREQLNISQKSSIMAGGKLSTTSEQMSRPKDMQYEQSVFRMIPPGRENAGMYQERFNRKVLSEGKVYEERKFLHEFILHVSGIDMSENVKMDGVTYARYQKEGKDKFVSIVSPESIVEHEGKKYVKRILRVEVEEDDEEQFDDAL
jgi:tRNA U55 pseudouridine synthase TruB